MEEKDDIPLREPHQRQAGQAARQDIQVLQVAAGFAVIFDVVFHIIIIVIVISIIIVVCGIQLRCWHLQDGGEIGWY